MRNYVDDGNLVTVTAPTALVTGTPVQVGSTFGVVHSNAAAGATVALRVRGRFKLPKLSASVLRAGTVACWDGRAIAASGQPVGYVSEDALAGTTSVVVLLTGTAPAASESQAATLTGLLSDSRRITRAGWSNSEGDAGIWWPLRENVATPSGSVVISDYSGQISGTFAGGTRRSGPWPGIIGDGASRVLMNGGAAGGFTTAARRCGDFSSLIKGADQITIWAVLHHPAGITGSDRAILSYGATESAKGGWSVGLGGSRERFYTVIAPKGVTTIANCRTELPGEKITGSALSPAPAYLNTMTAVAFEFMADAAGYLQCNMFSLPINVDYGIDLKLQSFNSLALVPAGSGGTGAATHDVDAPFCLGARPTTNATTFADNFNLIGFAQVGIMRHRWDQSLGARIVRDLRAAPRAFPASAAFIRS